MMRADAINTALAGHRSGGRVKTRRERLGELAATGELTRRGLVAGPLLAIAFAVAAFGGVYGWAYGIAYLTIYACLAVWLAQVWRGRLPLRWRWIYASLLAMGGLTALKYAFGLTLVRGDTLNAVTQLIPAALLFVLLTQVLRPDVDVGWIAPPLACLTAALGILAIAQLLTAGNAIYWHFRYTYASPAGPYVNRNNFAGCMELLIPIALLQAYRNHTRLVPFLGWSVAPVVGLGALLLSASRGGAVGMSVECVAGIALLLANRLRRRPAPGEAATKALAKRERHSQPRHARGRELDRLWIAMAIGFTLFMAMVALVGTQRLQSRFARYTMSPAQYGNLTSDSINEEKRDLLNQTSLVMWREHPVLGWGLGTWASAYPHYALFDDGMVYEFAHNDYLQWLSETGLAGASLLALFWIFWGVGVARGMRPAGPGRGLAVAAFLACLGLLVHSWVDFNLHIPANLLLFVTMAACGLPSAAGPAGQESFTHDS